MKAGLISAWLFVVLAGYAMRLLNLSRLRAAGHAVPAGFAGEIDAETLARARAYTLDKGRAELVESVFGNLLFFLFVFGGWLGIYDRWVASVAGSGILGGVFFFLGLNVATTVLGVPFGLYDTFRIESRYGFNATSARLWVSDFLKSLAVSSVLIGCLSAGALALVQRAPHTWWLWVWVFVAAVSVVLLFVSPYVIEPLFFKFEPVKTEGLAEGITRLMEKAGLRVGRVFQVDASTRSRHSNAYFTGIGEVKRVVLFDTLLAQMEPTEILAVLAHEIGHWKLRHVFKRILLLWSFALAALYLAFRLVSSGSLAGLAGLESASLSAQALILWPLVVVAGFVATPAFSFLARRNEADADRFACDLVGGCEALASALVKMSKENLANLHPHPLFAWFYNSHPPIVARVTALRGLDAERRARASSMISVV